MQADIVGKRVKLNDKGWASGWFLRGLEQMTRLDRRGWWVFWITVLLAFNLVPCMYSLAYGSPYWSRLPNTVVVCGYLFPQRPSIAGLWGTCVVGPGFAYLALLAVRIFATFACVCKMIAEDPLLRIAPTHPDAAGGLLPIGRVALFLSTFIFLVGVQIAVMPLNNYVIAVASGGAVTAARVVDPGLLELILAYLVLGAILFVVPLYPLRRVMVEKRTQYLLEAERRYTELYRGNQAHLREQPFAETSAQAEITQAGLIEAANRMGSWPVDRRTLLHVITLVGAPMIGPVVHGMSKMPSWIWSYLTGT